MARIIYAVAGEGNGHAIRAKTVIEHLIHKGHQVKIFSHGKGCAYLKKYYPVSRILGFHMWYLNNSVSNVLTGIMMVLKFPFMVLCSLRYIYDFLRYQPDVVISDFEPFACYYAHLFRIPIISIDNQHTITHTKIPKISMHYYGSWAIVTFFIPKPTYTLITSFFYPKIKKKNTTLVPPIIQKSVENVPEKRGDHILVYQTSTSYKELFNVLKKINKSFIVYGFDRSEHQENLVFKRFNEHEFLTDLARCDAVLINGGFNVLTEALALKKPVFSIPVHKQFEQMLNGYYLQKLGYGMAVRKITCKNFQEFLAKKEEMRRTLSRLKWDKNERFFTQLEHCIARIQLRKK